MRAGFSCSAGMSISALLEWYRVTRNGDAINKVGTYLKALAAHDCGVPFHVAMPFTSFDPHTACRRGRADRGTIRRRGHAHPGHDGGWREARCANRKPGSAAANPAFDVTPARLVTGYVTERGRLTIDELNDAVG